MNLTIMAGLRRISLLVLLLFIISPNAFAVNGYRLADLVQTPDQWEYHQGRVARGIDGDTIEMEDGTKIRMAGIDSPEVRKGSTPSEPGGDEARAWTAEKLAGKTIRYYVDTKNAKDKYQRTVALIFYWTGGSYNIDMIEKGHAEAAYLYLARDLKDEVFESAHKATEPPRISLNEGTLEELDGLPGVATIMAERIIEGRPYSSIDQLDNVRGIGAKKLAAIAPLVRL